GVDRVSDAHQVTAGVTTRFLDPDSGAERLRLGMAQRYLLRDQLVTPDGQPLTRRFSDLLLLASTTVIPSWTLDSSVQYSPDSNRVSRSVVSARYSPGPFRTISTTYRLTRGLSEQVELGWQWPLYGPTPNEPRPAGAGSGCQGSWYGVGRVNYSTLERRLVDAIVGVEYDAGCWIGRIVATRQSTGLSEATTRLLFQLELVGLSRLGSNPLQVLKDNIPGYKLLREGRAVAPASSAYD
ncbi:MAG TPA: LPS assembly protein LptD, partial [Burkholderiaceae bacterium]|nr:LPS assembly protein LptD [Burkholderiaceae bacterium]